MYLLFYAIHVSMLFLIWHGFVILLIQGKRKDFWSILNIFKNYPKNYL